MNLDVLYAYPYYEGIQYILKSYTQTANSNPRLHVEFLFVSHLASRLQN